MGLLGPAEVALPNAALDAIGPQVLTFNFGTGTDDGGSGLDGITQYAATSAVSFVTQSGWGYSY